MDEYATLERDEIMSDRSAVTLWIYEIPERKAEDVLEVIEDYGFTQDWFGSDPFTVEALLEGVDNQETFFIEEASLGTALEVSQRLEDLDVAHRAHQDPKYEWSGDLRMFHPKIGSWQGQADADGNAIVPDHQIRYYMKRSVNPVTLLDRIKEAVGITYEDRFRPLVGLPPLT